MTLKFTRADLEGEKSERTFGRILATGAQLTTSIGQAAFEQLSAKAREIQGKTPTMDFAEVFRRLNQAQPNAMRVVFCGEVGEDARFVDESDELSEIYELEAE